MKIRLTTAADSPALLALTALVPMRGSISLRIDRQPDFFQLLKARGEAIVLVADDPLHGIVGSFSAALQHYLIDQKPEPAYYLGDLRVHPAFAKSTVAYRLVKAMCDRMDGSVDLFLGTAADGNDSVHPFFSGRAGFPLFERSCTFSVFQLLPRAFSPDPQVGTTEDEAELLRFYRQFFSRFALAPFVEQVRDCKSFSVAENGRVVAALSLFDPGAFKQNVVIDFPWTVSLLLRIIKWTKPFLKLPQLPEKGRALRLLYVRYFGFEKGKEQLFLRLLDAARSYARRAGYHFVTVAVDNKDTEMIALIKRVSSFTFRSHHFVTSLAGRAQVLRTLKQELNYEDFSLI